MVRKRLSLRRHLYKVPLLFAALIISSLGLLPSFLNGQTSALGQIAHRALSISSGVPGQTNVTYSFTFTTVSTSAPIAGIKFIACDNAVDTYVGNTGSCTPPTGLSFSAATYNGGSQAGFTDSTLFSVDGTGANDCTPGANVLCINRSSATNDTQVSTDKTISVSTITNPTIPSGNGYTFYVGIWTYSTNNYTAGSRLDAGTTASAVVQTLTTSAAVAEVLNFCVGSTLIDDATTSVGNDCTAVSGTTVNIGTLDSSTINISPININGGNNMNGVAMLRTNAANGATVSYDAIQQSGVNHLGTLRISGASCDAVNDNTDQCINAAGASQAAFTAGTEDFGMTIAATNCGSTTSYTCVYTAASEHLVPSSNYVGDGSTGTPSTYTYGTTNGFAWIENGTITQIADSTTVVDDEALILKFAATPSITTPFGAYTAQSDYIAVATY